MLGITEDGCCYPITLKDALQNIPGKPLTTGPTFRKEGWKCDGCKQEIENEKHVMECTSYDHVRVGKKLEVDKDLISYFKEVMKIKMTNKK